MRPALETILTYVGRAVILAAGLGLAWSSLREARGICAWLIDIAAVDVVECTFVDGCEHCDGLPYDFQVRPWDNIDGKQFAQYSGCWDESGSLNLFMEER